MGRVSRRPIVFADPSTASLPVTASQRPALSSLRPRLPPSSPPVFTYAFHQRHSLHAAQRLPTAVRPAKLPHNVYDGT